MQLIRAAESAAAEPEIETGAPAIRIRGLRKSYGSKAAVDGIDLDVFAGEIFAFLGPNGAGKTTTVELLEGYRTRDAGEVSVLGTDPEHATRPWRGRIGVVLQTCDVWPELTVAESLTLFASYYSHPLPVDRVLDLVGLREDRSKRAGALSGGQMRRLDVGLALIGDPDLLFLDEPTTGFDPSARHHAWDVVSGLRELGKTVFLTTHYMDEAEYLADRVAVIADGRIVAQGTPREIGGRELERTAVTFELPEGAQAADLPVQPDDELSVSGRDVRLLTAGPTHTLAALTQWAGDRELRGLEARRPTLEDVYLQLTGGL
jgi:ABC-2 type transport system ATP-binding protein